MEGIVKAFCGRMDHGGCGLLVQVKHGRILEVKGDPDSFTRGYLCARGRAHIERLYHPDRLRYPQKRVGGRGANQWKRISWEEAIDTMVEKLKECKRRFGAEAALFMQGTPKGLENLLLYRFARSFGSPNVSATGFVCFAPRLGASLITNGFYPHPDLQSIPEWIVLWGSNHLSTAADGVLPSDINTALRGGSRLIVIDPVKRGLASKSHLSLQIKPGTDGLLALGMIKVIVEEERYDQEFVRKWTKGFEELKTYTHSYSLNEIERKTWISEDLIRKTSRIYSKAKSACILWGNAIDHNINSVQTARALLILMAISGNLDRPGGNIQAGVAKILRPTEFMLSKKYQAIQDKMIGKEFKLASMLGFVPAPIAIKSLRYGKPQKIDFVYIQGTNPLINYPDARETFEALQQSNFLVVSELFMTPTAQLADMVLPAASHFEFSDLGYYGLPFGRIQIRPKIVDPLGECRSDIRIINELALKLELEDIFWKDEEECIHYILKPSGYNFQDLKNGVAIDGEKQFEKFKEKGFPTESGKVELYSSWMKKNGYAPLPSFSEFDDRIEEEMDLIFTSAKLPVFFHSMNRNLPSLRKAHPEPEVWIHPETSKRIRIEEGDWVWIENKKGRARFKAKLSSQMDPRVIVGEHGWWFPEKEVLELYKWKESNINVLTESDPPYEPSIGTVNLRGIACRIYKS